MNPQTDLLYRMFDAAVQSAMPTHVMAANLPPPPRGRTVVIGGGKASAAMAKALELAWQGPKALFSGLVVTRYGYAVDCEAIEIVEAAHPVPDMAGQRATERMMGLVSGLSADDLVICLISGGASSLLSLPALGLSLANKQQINRELLACGANIHEMNKVRKHLSAIKGGRLAAACAPAQIVTLMISDVPDDDPSAIGSGPTVPDPSTFADALAILAKYGLDRSDTAVYKHLVRAEQETPKPDDMVFARTNARIVAAPQISLEAAAGVARKAGYTPLILGDSIEGEAREAALVHAGIAKQVCRHGQPVGRGSVLLSGGETTVTVRGSGRGGRNAEFALALALALNGLDSVYALAADTDGIDGSEDNAGAYVTPQTLAQAHEMGLSAVDYLANNDGYGFFQALDSLLVTGPTMTNVNDFRAILID